MTPQPPEAFLDGTRYFSLLFLRHESARVSTAALLQGRTRLASNKEVLATLRRVLTEWVASSEEGKEAWIASCEDMNIGDVLGGELLATPRVAALLAEHGVWISEGSASEIEEDAYGYDLVLVDAPACEETQA